MRFSDFCYTGLLDRSFNILYCDHPYLFQRLKKGSVKIRRLLDSSRMTDTVYYSFRAEGRRYSVHLEQMNDRFLVCRISEEVPETYVKDENLFRDIDGIRHGALTALSMAQMIRSFDGRKKRVGADGSLQIQLGGLSDVFADCMNILQLFEHGADASFTQLRKRLLHTCDVISFAVGPLMKRISFLLDIAPACVKIDYAKLELVLYNLTKLGILCSCEGSLSFLEIAARGEEMLDVVFRAPLQQNIFLDHYRIEMRAVKHIFRLLGGHFDFYERDGFFCGSGYAGAVFFDDLSRIPKENRLVLCGDFVRLAERRKSGAYERLYRYADGRCLFRPEAELEEVRNAEIRFAEVFFGGIISKASGSEA